MGTGKPRRIGVIVENSGREASVEKVHERSIPATSTTTLDVWIRKCWFWNWSQMLRVEALVVWTSG